MANAKNRRIEEVVVCGDFCDSVRGVSVVLLGVIQ